MTVTIKVDEKTAERLRVLLQPDVSAITAADVVSVIVQLIDHAQQGVYRPGAWERGWICQAFGDAWIDYVESDTAAPMFDVPKPKRRWPKK